MVENLESKLGVGWNKIRVYFVANQKNGENCATANLLGRDVNFRSGDVTCVDNKNITKNKVLLIYDNNEHGQKE